MSESYSKRGQSFYYFWDLFGDRVECWRSLTERRISSSWLRESTSLQRRLRMCMYAVDLWPKCLCMETAYRYVGCWHLYSLCMYATLGTHSFFIFQSCLVAVVVPDPEVLPGFAKNLGCQGSIEDLCKNTVSLSFFLHTCFKGLFLLWITLTDNLGSL